MSDINEIEKKQLINKPKNLFLEEQTKQKLRRLANP